MYFWLYNTGSFRSQENDTGEIPPSRSSLLADAQPTWEPGLASVITTKFDYIIRVGLLVIDPKAISTLPLQHGQAITGSGDFNDAGISPGSGIFDENDTIFEITIVNLELYVTEGDSAERSEGQYFPWVEFTFDEY